MTITATIGESAEQRQAREAAAAAAAAADADRSTYQEIDDRTWALVAKDPKSHIAEKFVIFGKATQFGWTCRWPSQCRSRTAGLQLQGRRQHDGRRG